MKYKNFLFETQFPTPKGKFTDRRVIKKNNYKCESVLIIEPGEGRGSKKFLSNLVKEITTFIKSKTDISFEIEIESGRDPVINVIFSEYFSAVDMSNITVMIANTISSDILQTSWSV